MNHHHQHSQRAGLNWLALAGVGAAFAALGAALFLMQPAGASANGCKDASVPVFTDVLDESWYEASWSGTTIDSSAGYNEVTFPERWSAFSVQSKSVNVADCQDLVFSIASTSDDPKLRVRLNSESQANAGSLNLNDAAFIESGTVTASLKEVRIPLENFILPDQEVSRISLINTGATGGIDLIVDEIRFEGAAPLNPPEGQTPELVESQSCPIIYVDRLENPWQPASWSVDDINYSAPSPGADSGDTGDSGTSISATFPQRWGAVSVLSTSPIDVAGCSALSFDVSASTAGTFRVELSGADRSVDGSTTIQVGTSVENVHLPLDQFGLSGNQISRVALVNQGPESGMTLSVDNIMTSGVAVTTTESQIESQPERQVEGQPATQIESAPSMPGSTLPEQADGVAAKTTGTDETVVETPSEPTTSMSSTPEYATTTEAPVNSTTSTMAPAESTTTTPEPPAESTTSPKPPAQNAAGEPKPVAPVSASPGGKFKTLPPGSSLPSGSACASRVRSAPETVPENTPWNQRKGRSVVGQTYIADQLYYVDGPAAFEARIDGNYTGTTDEIIQWAACKWGFDEDLIRAQVYTESSWFAGRLGDCGDGPTLARTGGDDGCDSNGLLQVRGSDILSTGFATHRGTFPMAWDSSAFNLDYALAVERICFEGQEVWLADAAAPGTSYAAGDLYGCLGRWYSGEWRVPGAINYINNVKKNLVNRSWENPSGRGCPEWNSNFYCSNINRNVDGSRRG